MYDKPAFLSIK